MNGWHSPDHIIVSGRGIHFASAELTLIHNYRILKHLLLPLLFAPVTDYGASILNRNESSYNAADDHKEKCDNLALFVYKEYRCHQE